MSASRRNFDIAVVFDFGGVLTTSPREALASWANSLQVHRDSFSTVMRSWMSAEATPDSPVHLMERGQLTGIEFNAALRRELRTSSGQPLTPANYLAQIFELIHPEPAMHTLLNELRSSGVGLALLSNSWDNEYPADLLAVFDAVILSGETGLRKPEHEIFLLTLDQLGIGAEQAILIDDNRHNIAAAQNLGMAGILHTTPTETIQELREIFPDSHLDKFSTIKQGETQ